MNPNLLPNREIENYEEQDDFNFLIKADAIKIFLEQNSTSLEKNKMLVLYGEWGSGKTSLMKHIEQTINNGIYKTIFFHAWEHEKDENLVLSLCDALTDCLDRDSLEIKSFMRGALIAFKSFTSGITLKAPGFLSGLGLDFEFSGEKYIDAIDKALKAKNPSFYKSNKEFKESFIKVEELILKQTGALKLLIFVDDLDRCEPENVLNLITALKLFFTYGEKSVFFCGMDKEAVNRAVKTRYKDVIKSEEYMEKVFDISFNMPKTFSLKKMLERHFKGEIKISNGTIVPNHEIIEDFFKSVGFTNPRHIKKVLSKYEIIKSFKVLSTIPKDIRILIPNIIEDDKEGNVFETIYCLFFIILYEFNYKDFLELESYEEKMQKYIEPMYKVGQSQSSSSHKHTYGSTISHINNYLLIQNFKSFTVKSLLGNIDVPPNKIDNYQFTKFILFFSHSHPNLLPEFSDKEMAQFFNSFDDKEFLTLYCKFLIRQKNDLIKYGTDYPIWNLFEMVKYLL